MPYITFIYRIDDKFKKVYYGKYYKNYIYNSEMDNLVDEIKPYLVRCINKYRKLNNLTKIKKNKIFNQQPNLVFRIGLKKYYDESWNNCPNLIPSGVGGNEFAPQEFDPTEFA